MSTGAAASDSGNNRIIQSVTGPVSAKDLGVADAHCHLWIAPTAPDLPRLEDEQAAREELSDFARSGGDLVLDCQPGGAGRNGAVLERLARATGVTIVASTGFHLKRYHCEGGPWSVSQDQARDLFVDELKTGVEEAATVRAGSIKTAWTGAANGESRLMAAAMAAALDTGAPITVHTEQGRGVDGLVKVLETAGVSPGKVQISHIDKRPDHELHAELARTGYILGYDTFLRPQYDPEDRVWPLLAHMVGLGFWSQIAIGLDLVDQARWRVSGGPGLRSIGTVIVKRLRDLGTCDEGVRAMTGGNIATMLAGGRG